MPGPHRRCNALHLDRAEITAFEQIPHQLACARGDDHRSWVGQGLQAGGEVRCFTNDRLLPRRSFADQIADNHQPGADPDARLRLD